MDNFLSNKNACFCYNIIMKLALLSGVLAIIAFLPPQFIGSSLAFGGPFKFSFVFAFFCLVPFFIFLEKESRFWRLLLGTFIFRLILLSGTVYYTLEPITWILSLLIFCGLALTIFLIKKVRMPDWAFFTTLTAIWTIWDLLEAEFSLLPGYIITLGNALGSSPFSGLASIGGLTTLILFAVAINSLIAIAIMIKKIPKKSTAIILAILFIILADALAISKFLLQKNADDYGNLKNSLKITAVSVDENFGITEFNQLKNELENKNADLIILPEDILNNAVGTDFYKNIAEELKTNVAATLTVQAENGRYNSTILLDQNGEISGDYNKNRLTFIGEYWPFGNWRPSFFEWLKKRNPQYDDYAIFNPQNPYFKGEKKILEIKTENGNTVNFASLICLEINYPADLMAYKKMGAKFIINPSSNRWISLGENHFLYLTGNLKKIESIWLKIPIISAGVNDIAGITTPDGKTAQKKGVFEGEIKY